jgi:hydrophobic/amphiphilic exporter-1 (mainly G- bacteria), HAE1 family
MKIADVSVQRPVFAIMMTAALIVLGAVSYESLGLDLMPKTDVPVVSVQANLPGASAEEIETQITKRIEEAVNTISGIDELRASSDQGNSRVTINFTLERDIESATQDVRDKLAQIVNQFPRDTRPLQITKMDPDSQPIFGFAVFGPRAPKELTEIAEKRVKQELETVQDVGSVGYNGERKREIQLLLDADRLNAYGLTVDEVRTAVQRQNVEIPGGQFTAGPAEVAVRTMGRIRNVEDFNRIVIAYRTDGSVITFADVGRVQDSVQEVRGATRLSGTPAIGVQVRKQSGTNTVEVVDRVQERLARIQSQLPQDIQISVGNDQSRFIRRSFEDIKMHLILGGLLASVVVFLFIRNLRITFIAALAIPTSIIGTFTFMNMAGFTLNNMTMLALSLATGIVIDDAIVVLENIFRYVEEKGVSPKEAAAAATQEIGMAVMATTFSLVVIFVPVAFMTGQIGRYFYSFGLTSAAAILISMFVSFTLTPALCAMWMKKEDIKADHSTTKSGGVYAKIDGAYGRMLLWALRHRPAMMVIAGLVVLSALFLYPYVGKELVPDDDQGEFSINVRLPRGTSYQRTEEFIKPIEQEILALPGLQRVMQNVNSNFANFNIMMLPLEERDVTQQELMIQARQMLRKYQGARISVSGGTDISGASSGGGGRGGGGPGGPGGGGGGGGFNRLNILIQGPDIQQLQEYTTQLLAKIREIPGVVDADTNFEPTQPELRINVDRARAADLGVNIDSLANSLRTLVGGEEVSEFKDGDDQFKVLLRLDEAHRNPATMGDLLIPAGPGRTVKVSDVATLKNDYGPAAIDRYNRQRQISVNGNLQGVPLGEVLTAARAKVEELHLKPGYQAVFGGSARTLAEASSNFTIALVLAVIFIYMVLASQFNSFIHPLTIMTALPLSLPAGLLALMAFGMTLNVYSAIGLMMLFGIVKKNSILQVDYTNTLRAQGVERHEALIQANHVRLRPILMTTIAIIAGMLPIAFGKGAGAGSRASLAVTILGGQILCLVLTLLVTPVVYSYFDDLREWSPGEALRRLTGRAARKPVPAEQSGS